MSSMFLCWKILWKDLPTHLNKDLVPNIADALTIFTCHNNVNLNTSNGFAPGSWFRDFHYRAELLLGGAGPDSSHPTGRPPGPDSVSDQHTTRALSRTAILPRFTTTSRLCMT